METTELKESLARIMVQQEAFVEAFYSQLLERYPHLRPFFAHLDMRRQRASLLATLSMLASADERAEAIQPALRKLGHVHHELQIRAEHYPPFGETLLATMARFDLAWTPALHAAWTRVIDRCVRGMMRSYEPDATVYRVQVGVTRRKKA